MKELKSLWMVLLTAATIVRTSEAQVPGFTVGSNGSYGDLTVPPGTTRTIDMAVEGPADGVFHCKVIAVEGTLKFKRNALNTPVYLLAQREIIISGLIDVSGSPAAGPRVGGQGGPGGFDGGIPAYLNLPPGAGQGPGAGKESTPLSYGGAGVYSLQGATYERNGEPYGSPLLIPLVGGSGGGGGANSGSSSDGGAGGGGAIMVASDRKVEIRAGGAIAARGGGYFSVYSGVGSGGAIRILSPVVSGTGALVVDGGQNPFFLLFGGYGRVRIDAIDKSNMNWSLPATPVTTIGANMVTSISPLPRLDITEVAGRAIPVGTANPVSFVLDFGSDPKTTVKIRAQDFQGLVPIRVVLTPDNGEPRLYDKTINMAGENPVTINVEFPINTPTRVTAWTR